MSISLLRASAPLSDPRAPAILSPLRATCEVLRAEGTSAQSASNAHASELRVACAALAEALLCHDGALCECLLGVGLDEDCCCPTAKRPDMSCRICRDAISLRVFARVSVCVYVCVCFVCMYMCMHARCMYMRTRFRQHDCSMASVHTHAIHALNTHQSHRKVASGTL
jgi:hypothetical protein